MRGIFSAGIVILLVGSASAFSFGVVHRNTNVEASSSTPLNLELVNPSDKTLLINFDAEDIQNATVDAPEDIILKPSKKSGSPDEGSWISSGSEYLSTRRVRVQVKGVEPDQDFVLSTTAQPVSSSDQKVSSEMVQVREHRYILNASHEELKSLIGPDNSESQGDGDLPPKLILNNESQPYQTQSGETWRNDSRLSWNQSSTLSAESSNSNPQKLQTSTMLLALTLIGSVAYLYTVV